MKKGYKTVNPRKGILFWVYEPTEEFPYYHYKNGIKAVGENPLFAFGLFIFVEIFCFVGYRITVLYRWFSAKHKKKQQEQENLSSEQRCNSQENE